jgi:RNA polymerase sigma factor (TIGR02999 family)
VCRAAGAARVQFEIAPSVATFGVDFFSTMTNPPAHDEDSRGPEEGPPGERRPAAEILPAVYAELRRLAASRLARYPGNNTLQPTALVHEAYVQLVGGEPGKDPLWRSRAHFFGAVALAMRNILVDQRRRKAAVKRGGDRKREAGDPDGLGEMSEFEFIEPKEDLLALDEALKKLEAKDARKAQIVMLRYFAGLSIQQTAEVLGVDARTVNRDWQFVKAWLHREMGGVEVDGEAGEGTRPGGADGAA